MSWIDEAGDDWTAAAVSPQLWQNIAEMGPDAERWLDSVPERVATIENAWGLEVGPPVSAEGHVSVAFEARTANGVDAVLKVTVPHDEAETEAAALQRWGGRGAVKLLGASDDGFTLLLERCRPGHDLFTLPPDEHVDVLAELFPQLWIQPHGSEPFPELDATVARWERDLPALGDRLGVRQELAGDARRWAAELRCDMPRRILHGDLHPQNVLAAQRQPWLAIDPKPWVGDPAFDLAQTLVNWVRIGPIERGAAVEDVLRRARRLSGVLGLDVNRVLRWAVVKGFGWEFAAEETLVLHGAATSV